MGSPRPPFRADQVGSLLRPPVLRAAREQWLRGAIDHTELRRLEDRCIREAIALQEAIGLQAVTDGEFRRTSFHADFIEKLEGARSAGRLAAGSAAQPDPPGLPAQSETAAPAARPGAAVSAPHPGAAPERSDTFKPRAFAVTAKLRHTRPIEVENFCFVRDHTRRVAKQTIPSPTMLLRGGRAAVSTDAYPDLQVFHRDIVAVFREELRQLATAGCTYLQLDDTNYAYLCDPRLRASHREFGDDPEGMADRYAQLINATIDGRPRDMVIAIHLCRGNSSGQWAAEGGYEPIADCLFNRVDADAYFLEFDDARSGGFEPLRLLPRNSPKKIVLGLVSTKTPFLESKDALKRRIDEAARYVPLDSLCLSPQCGFASTFLGNPVGEDVQRRKLERVVEVAAEVWGTATA